MESRSLQPLYTIVILILITATVGSMQNGEIALMTLMGNMMAGFFLVFSGFKLLNVPGFANGYAKYDLLARNWRGWGYLYPFIELSLGLCYLVIPTNFTLNLTAVSLMIFGAIGVVIKLAKREQFQCACPGTFINVPLTKVTLVENLVMAAMATAMILV